MPKSLGQDWPTYQIGPRESVFAIGVASTKFTELESVLCFLFATVFRIGSDDATMIVAKVGNIAAVILMEQKLDRPSREELAIGEIKPKTALAIAMEDHVRHFIKGFHVCASNRDHLMHSGLAWTGRDEGDTILFKTSKQGDTTISLPEPGKLRAVADGMDCYAHYGRAAANAINIRLASDPPAVPFPWPDKPPLPHKLEYKSDRLQPQETRQGKPRRPRSSRA